MTWSQTGVGGPSDPSAGKVRVIYSTDQLGAPTGGVYTLEAGIGYFLYNLLELGSNRVNPNGALAIVGFDRELTGFTTNTGSPLIQASGQTLALRNLTLKNTGGKALAYTGGAGKKLRCDAVMFTNGARDTVVGAAGHSLTAFRDCSWEMGVDGLQVSGEHSAAAVRGCSFFGQSNASARLLEFAAGWTGNLIDINGSGFFTNQPGQTGVYVDGAIQPTLGGGITRCGFASVGTKVAGINEKTRLWTIHECNGVKGSTFMGRLGFSGNATPTTNPGIGQWTEITTGAPWSLDASGARFVKTAAPRPDRLRYDGVTPHSFAIDLALTIEPVSGTGIELEVRVRKRDADTAVESTIGDAVVVDYRSNLYALPIPLTEDLKEGDEVFVEIRNNDTAANMVVGYASLRAAFLSL